MKKKTTIVEEIRKQMDDTFRIVVRSGEVQVIDIIKEEEDEQNDINSKDN